MNLYLRLLWTLLRSLRLPAITVGETLERTLRVLPNDLDINGHMNNGRYMTVVDLMLIEYFVRSGFARAMLRQGWRPMAGGSFITYRKGLKPLQRYRLRFRQEGADTHWNYMRFEFLREDGTLCAAGYMKGAAVAREGPVPNARSYATLGWAFEPGDLPEPVRHWLAAEGSVMAAARA
ncbi:thioesterase family protein [Schlegelella sp. S2-27]|uniref:Thioesterase family protein n=1 Tax=Caldimonas mangrovi TaxID=2944811 RepID=A0ABT0YU33_9BURK|nr:acyl-CoA thioesterase [Caldimonas mangrovi]MCM5682265.1 thioesterase family protein [Caldimonas mangrovi]